jgi:hypothetical protein
VLRASDVVIRRLEGDGPLEDEVVARGQAGVDDAAHNHILADRITGLLNADIIVKQAEANHFTTNSRRRFVGGRVVDPLIRAVQRTNASRPNARFTVRPTAAFPFSV